MGMAMPPPLPNESPAGSIGSRDVMKLLEAINLLGVTADCVFQSVLSRSFGLLCSGISATSADLDAHRPFQADLGRSAMPRRMAAVLGSGRTL